MRGYKSVSSQRYLMSWRHWITLLMLSLTGVMITIPASAEREPTRRWKITCTFVNSAPDDPIVYPNKPGASHLHDFYGNVGIDASVTTAADLDTFASNCPDQDRSAYWTPALYQNGNKLTPASLLVYYENKSLAAGKLQAFPDGFKYVLGIATATDAATTESHWIWACAPFPGEEKTQYGHLPPANCDSGSIQLRAEFPNCWDGKLEADGNARGHMAWANGLAPAGHGEPVVDVAKNTCPAAYPKALPMLRMVLNYKTGEKVGTITLSSGNGSPYSKHGDFFNGWDNDTLQALIDKCLNTANASCEQLRGTTPAPTTSARIVLTRVLRSIRLASAQLSDESVHARANNMCLTRAPAQATSAAANMMSKWRLNGLSSVSPGLFSLGDRTGIALPQ